MASRSRWRGRAWRACLLTAAVASLAGCVGMPNNGPATEFTASPEASQPNSDFIGLFPSAPPLGGSPSQIVQGFLVASANYPAYATLADEYLVASAVKTYNPSGLTVLNPFGLAKSSPAQTAAGSHGVSRATVQTQGSVVGTFGSSPQGQYFWLQSQAPVGSSYTFQLVKVSGQWRISNPPRNRMLLSADFQYYFETRDLYFFGTSLEDQVLVPDSVFVPLGTDEQHLVAGLVSALSQDPKTPWLANATQTDFPSATRILGVSVDGATATVNLGGAITHAGTKTLQQVAAQLVWTLISSAPGPGGIQSVELQLNGQPWSSPGPPCTGGPSPRAFQTLAAYQCYNPFPSVPASFYYTSGAQAWSRCGRATQAQTGSIGQIVPLLSHTGVISQPDCGNGQYVLESQATATPAQPSSIGPVALASVSPDGKYLAVVPPGRDAVYIVNLPGSATSLPGKPRLSAPGITALSWDRSDNLWVAQDGSVDMLPPGGKAPVVVMFNGGMITDLSVAPDSVRIALIVQTGSARELVVAAIGPPSTSGTINTKPNTVISPALGSGTALAPNLTRPVSLAWYNADNLIALNGVSGQYVLWEVPVDGQAATAAFTPKGAASISADGSANVLVAGLDGGHLAVSPGLEGPWQQLANPGQDPAYP